MLLTWQYQRSLCNPLLFSLLFRYLVEPTSARGMVAICAGGGVGGVGSCEVIERDMIQYI